MCYSAIAVANFFIEKSIEEKRFLTVLHLIKMAFLSHAVFYNTRHKPLFSDPVVAWKHGPVIASLYHNLKHYGNSPITESISVAKPVPDNGKFSFQLVTPNIRPDDKEISDFLTVAWNKLSTIDAWRLRMYSHEKGGAWYETVSKIVDDPNNEESLKSLPRNLTILDKVIEECGR